MDDSFRRFLESQQIVALDCIPAPEYDDQLNSDLENIQREIEILQNTSNETTVNTERVQQALQTAQSLVKQIDSVESDLHEVRSNGTQMAQEIKAVESDIADMWEHVESLIANDSLEFDANLTFSSFVEEAELIKSNLIQRVLSAALGFDLQSIVADVIKVVDQRKKINHLTLERDSMSAVIDNLTRGNDSMEEEFSELNAELNGIIAETTQIEMETDALSNQQQEISHETKFIIQEYNNERDVADKTIAHHQRNVQMIEIGLVEQSGLNEHIASSRQLIEELKNKLEARQVEHNATKGKLLEQFAKEKRETETLIVQLQQKKLSIDDELNEANAEMERCLRIRSRRIQSELDEVDLDEKISKMQREISKLAIETKLLQDRTESYRLEAGEKVAIRKTNAETLKKTLDEREAFCNTQMAIIEELDRSLNEKTAMLNELKMEIHGGALPNLFNQSPFKPMCSSTPITVRPSCSQTPIAKTRSSRKKQPIMKSQPTRGSTRSSRGSKKK